MSPAPSDYVVPEIPELNGEKVIRLNAETTGVEWWGEDKAIGWAYFLPESGRKGYLPIRHEQGGNLPVERVNQFLSDIKNCQVDNTNTKFDLHIAMRDGVDLREHGNTFGDAAHFAALLDDNRRRFNLDQLSKDILGWDVSGDKIPAEITTEAEFKYLHPNRVAPYAIRNVEQVAQLIDVFMPQIEEEKLERVLNLEQQVIPAVVEMEENGTLLDMEMLHEYSTRCDAEYNDLMWSIKKTTGLDLESPDSPKGLEQLFAKLNLPITHRTLGGRPSFTAAALAEHAHVPEIAHIIRAGQLADLDSKYLRKYKNAARGDGWLRFNLHQLRYGKGDDDKVGAVSGRFSASGDSHGGYNPQQVVAVEKQLERNWLAEYVLRRLFIPSKGGVFMAADMKQIEYRIFAHYANDPQILAAYAADPDADFHAVVMKLLHRVAPHLNRKLVKNVNFAKIYGAGLIKFAFMLGLISVLDYEELSERLARHDWSALEDYRLDAAREIDDAYNEMFPQVKPLLRRASHIATPPGSHDCNWKCEKFFEQGYEHRGYVCDLIGRRARLTGRFHSALNRIIQGGAASINKMALVAVYEARKSLDFIMRLTVHDELAGDLMNPGKLGALTALLNHQRFPLKVPVLWDVKTGPNWAACK